MVGNKFATYLMSFVVMMMAQVLHSSWVTQQWLAIRIMLTLPTWITQTQLMVPSITITVWMEVKLRMGTTTELRLHQVIIASSIISICIIISIYLFISEKLLGAFIGYSIIFLYKGCGLEYFKKYFIISSTVCVVPTYFSQILSSTKDSIPFFYNLCALMFWIYNALCIHHFRY